MRGTRWLHWLWSSEPAEVYRSYETPDALLQRFQASMQPDSLRQQFSSDYAILMKRSMRGMRLRIRRFGIGNSIFGGFPLFAYVRLKDRGDHTEVRLSFGYGPLFDTYAWLHVALFVMCLALVPRHPSALAMGTLVMLVVLQLRRLGRSRSGLRRRSHLRSVVVSGLRKPPSDDAAGVGQTA